MSQQINLFNPIFLKQKKYLSVATMAQALGLIFLGSIVLAAFAFYQSSRLGTQAASTSAHLGLAQAQLTKFNAEYAPRQKSKAIEQALQKTEDDVKVAQQILATLQKGELGNTKGYSEYLRAFSRQQVEGLWLTGFRIDGAGAAIGLEGRALRPDLVPTYINRLKRESVMQGKSFATLEMSVPQVDEVLQASQTDQVSKGSPAKSGQLATAGYIDFNLQSAVPESAGASTGVKRK